MVLVDKIRVRDASRKEVFLAETIGGIGVRWWGAIALPVQRLYTPGRPMCPRRRNVSAHRWGNARLSCWLFSLRCSCDQLGKERSTHEPAREVR